MLTAIALAGQRAAVRTARGPLRPLWALAYRLTARAAAAYIRATEPGATVYVRGSLATGEPLYGVSDIDLAIVVPAEFGRPGQPRRRIHDRWRALARRLPPLKKLVQIKVYEGDELRRTTMQIRPGLGRPASDWLRIAGDGLRPAGDARAPDPHLAAWLELQWWWRLACDACLWRNGRHIPYLCLKLIAQSARVRLWLERNELVSRHTEVLARGRATMPDEEDTLRLAERLSQELPHDPHPPLAEAIGFLLRTTARVAERLSSELRPYGHTDVRLLGAEAAVDDLALAPEARAELSRLTSDRRCERVLPLADWRARAPRPLIRDDRVNPLLPDEALAILRADLADPAELGQLARLSDSGLRSAAGWGPVLVLPSTTYFAWFHRAIQFECSDPVSYALLAGERQAPFPNVSGWSAADCARREVEAHTFWLQGYPSVDPEETGTTLGLLLGAVRAALFEQSLERGKPELAVTIGAAADCLAAEHPGSAGLLEEAVGSYRAWRVDGGTPDPAGVTALRGLVQRLPAYASGAPGVAPARSSEVAQR
jgi:predicted nucleotidyltransferase